MSHCGSCKLQVEHVGQRRRCATALQARKKQKQSPVDCAVAICTSCILHARSCSVCRRWQCDPCVAHFGNSSQLAACSECSSLVCDTCSLRCDNYGTAGDDTGRKLCCYVFCSRCETERKSANPTTDDADSSEDSDAVCKKVLLDLACLDCAYIMENNDLKSLSIAVETAACLCRDCFNFNEPNNKCECGHSSRHSQAVSHDGFDEHGGLYYKLMNAAVT
jgi:hypothetical protein